MDLGRMWTVERMWLLLRGAYSFLGAPLVHVVSTSQWRHMVRISLCKVQVLVPTPTLLLGKIFTLCKSQFCHP